MASPERIAALAGLVGALLAATATAAPPAALSSGAGRFYCCTGDDGRRVCGDILPAQCQTRAYREVSHSGAVKEMGPPLTPEQRAQRDAEALRKKELEKAAAEQQRRNQALLGSYGSERDIDIKRDKMLAEIEKSRQIAQERYDEALQRKSRLAQEAEFYLKKPMPPQLAGQLKENEDELAAQKAILGARQQEMDTVRNRFEDEKRRYRELSGGHASSLQNSAAPRQ